MQKNMDKKMLIILIILTIVFTTTAISFIDHISDNQTNNNQCEKPLVGTYKVGEKFGKTASDYIVYCGYDETRGAVFAVVSFVGYSYEVFGRHQVVFNDVVYDIEYNIGLVQKGVSLK